MNFLVFFFLGIKLYCIKNIFKAILLNNSFILILRKYLFKTLLLQLSFRFSGSDCSLNYCPEAELKWSFSLSKLHKQLEHISKVRRKGGGPKDI